jgi:ribosomal protein S12 methylthiotransferase accessory factor
LQKYEDAGIAVAAWETTSDIGISSFLCMIVDRADHCLHPLYGITGMGCHPARGVALLRALTEAAQGRLTAIAGSRDDLFRSYYEMLLDPDRRSDDHTLILTGSSPHSFTGSTWETEIFDEDVAWELDRLRAAGIERVAVVDLTKPEFQLPVVRVIIPGLESTNIHGPYRYGNRARRIMERDA